MQQCVKSEASRVTHFVQICQQQLDFSENLECFVQFFQHFNSITYSDDRSDVL